MIVLDGSLELAETGLKMVGGLSFRLYCGVNPLGGNFSIPVFEPVTGRRRSVNIVMCASRRYRFRQQYSKQAGVLLICCQLISVFTKRGNCDVGENHKL